MNPQYIADALILVNEHKDTASSADEAVRKRIALLAEAHEWVLPARLPPMSRLELEAQHSASEAQKLALLSSSVSEALNDEMDVPLFETVASPPAMLSRAGRSSSSGSVKAAVSGMRGRIPSFSNASGGKAAQAKKRDWESHDVYRAIERKDLTTLFEIRDAAFHLLVQKMGNQTPLLYASRIGKSHREIAILLTGALSRFVNNLPDDSSVLEPKTISLIRAVRVNLKLAINESLSSNQTELVSSYLQIIIMAEGDKWVLEQTNSVALAIKTPNKEGKPVQTARNAVHKFATRELRSLEKGATVASVEDYLANATNDLIMMALWSIVTDKLGGKLLPSYQFGRDDRIFKTFSDSIDIVRKRAEWVKSIPKPLRTQIDATIEIMGGRATSHTAKSKALAELFDGRP